MINKLQVGYLVIGFTAGFYFAINLDQAYYFSLHHKLFLPLRDEINKADRTFSTVFNTFKQGIKNAYDDI
ncbi:unnamed protein product (macronuclear) [Paramecium tetraurelia]|uniref:Uncharacterized protein n=1 Tax=Paramecium tetraurelia TaxID=5888 RepID=A0E7P5_PARTE|nr:uncharacterized protein GSPATT00024040001 [Paramecium tetraurelia]CAK91312.1 unnamed protein product [Paramecium tetraurelia]|eukprot:XP_001458709.1 hypothetical protein (macronuclear) [Paramecium tetraurelia strain d4-2]